MLGCECWPSQQQPVFTLQLQFWQRRRQRSTSYEPSAQAIEFADPGSQSEGEGSGLSPEARAKVRLRRD